MIHDFDHGYDLEPFASLVRDYPGPDVYPVEDFRIEWGPIFHRGRLDGTARVLVIGQDPGAHESFVRRILVGEAGQRAQGFLAKVGIERSYVMINAFLYSVYGQWAATHHSDDEAIAAYRNRWIDAVFETSDIEAVVAFGSLADVAFSGWLETSGATVAYEHVFHPTYPEGSSGGNPTKRAEAMVSMLAQWNAALQRLSGAISHPDVDRAFVPYGTDLLAQDHSPIPEADLPPGLPEWMRGLLSWCAREGETTDLKRATLVAQIPTGLWPWAAEEDVGGG
jgi:hypothetical protein